MCIRDRIESFGGVEKIKGMGVGAPNGNYYNGTIEFAPNLPWKGVIPLATLLDVYKRQSYTCTEV